MQLFSHKKQFMDNFENRFLNTLFTVTKFPFYKNSEKYV